MRATLQSTLSVFTAQGIFATKLHQRSVFTAGNICDEIASESKLK